ncbi:MAG TPA: type II toxin-antitoxin system Phd/YefM family antitoxin [Acidobacteriaceae bacterium]|nr:type II toxin-antitoxin system Phd/YefM family antitoxin [Acidobacteriaceae bacterium]
MATTVSTAYAKANLTRLLKDASQGKTILIARYNKPMAALVPVSGSERRPPKFGTGKGRIRILDPHWADPMTDEEVEAMMEGRY